jgi:hypothetical protein
MGTDRRRQLLAGALAVGLLVVVYRVWTATSVEPPPASNERGTGPGSPRTGGAAAQATGAAADVHLQALGADRPKPRGADRNLFRFRPKAPPPLPPSLRPLPPPVVNPEPPGPPPPPPVPPIPLKFIGTVERGGQKLAILSDSAGHVSFGPEGSTIDGRYRIIRIGAESVEMAYVDGRGRQVIRLTGG